MPRPTHKLEDHPSSAVRECLQCTFGTNLCICPQLEMVPCRGDTDPFIIARSTGDYRFRGIGSFRLYLTELCIKIVTVTKLQCFHRVPDLHFSGIYESFHRQLTITDHLQHSLPILYRYERYHGSYDLGIW